MMRDLSVGHVHDLGFQLLLSSVRSFTELFTIASEAQYLPLDEETHVPAQKGTVCREA